LAGISAGEQHLARRGLLVSSDIAEGPRVGVDALNEIGPISDFPMDVGASLGHSDRHIRRNPAPRNDPARDRLLGDDLEHGLGHAAAIDQDGKGEAARIPI
jgi:hypothetical protein